MASVFGSRLIQTGMKRIAGSRSGQGGASLPISGAQRPNSGVLSPSLTSGSFLFPPASGAVLSLQSGALSGLGGSSKDAVGGCDRLDLTSITARLSSVGIATKPKPDSPSKSVSDSAMPPPPPPKQPAPVFGRFCSEYRPKVFAAHPELKATEAVKVLAEMWKKLNPTEKAKYKEAQKKILAKYKMDYLKWKSTITTDQKEAYFSDRKASILEKKQKRDKKEENRWLKDRRSELKTVYKKPPKPRTQFFIYRDQMGMQKGQSAKHSMMELADKYKRLPTSEKAKLDLVHNRERADYEAAMLSWSRKMIKEGHWAIVPKSFFKRCKDEEENST